MALFGKKKDIPVTPAPTVSYPSVDPDDFFKDMGRKPKAPKGLVDITSPEITGLREKPLEAPGSTIKDNDMPIDTDTLTDKTLLPPDPEHAHIRTINTETIDTTVIPKEEKIFREEKPLSADDFFKDLDRKRPRSIDIDLPEVDGVLRAEPIPHHVTDIGDAEVDESAVEALHDKSGDVPDFVVGDINLVDVSHLDMSSLRAEREDPEPTEEE
ncbi:MAG: hypothetical protein II782_05015 [Oscillospiraceae bacterium]|nr:hypothetical protein [Oscillospiraceae bacterium]